MPFSQGLTRRCRHSFTGILSLTAWVCCVSAAASRDSVAPEGSSWWDLYTLDSSDIPQNHASPFLLGILGVWHNGQNGNLGTQAQSRQQDSAKWREHGNCASSQMIAKKREYVAVMSVGFPKRRPVACRLSKTLLCRSRGFASLPLVAKYHQSSSRTVVPRNLTVVLLRSVRPWHRKAVRRALGRTVSVWRYHVHSRPSSFTVFPSSLVLHRKGFSLVRSVPYRGSVSVLSVSGALWSDAEAIYECILFCLELSHAAR